MNATNVDSEATGGHSFELSGGALCLDFTNTVGDRPVGKAEHLTCYGDVLAWGYQSGAIDRSQLECLSQFAEGHPDNAADVFRRAVELRESLYRIFSSLAAGHVPARKDVATLNQGLRAALQHLKLQVRQGEVRWYWEDSRQQLDSVLWAVARSAGDLLTSEELGLVRECASDVCSWLFLDRSRNTRRRWCDMKTCGNRAKARRHYRRQKARFGPDEHCG